MKNTNAFARARMMMTAIAAAMALGGTAQRDALAGIGPYISRGKGRGTASKKFGNKRGKYTPHIGKKEQERAARCIMTDSYQSPYGKRHNDRAAPIMMQFGK